MAHRQIVLGIDVGTSGTKVVAVSESGVVLASATSGYEMYVPLAGYAEQNPDDWWQGTVLAVNDVLQQLRQAGYSSDVASISFSGQMHGLVPLDGEGRVIRPSIIWCDLRSANEAQWLERTIGRDQIIKWTENPPLPNFTVTKLLWMREHEPEAYARIQTMLLPKDYVRFKMTNAYAMDVADASGTLLFDVAKRKWSKDMCQAVGIPVSWLPPIAESSDVVGYITKDASRQLGIAQGTPVVAGAGDQAAGAMGLGIVDSGAVSAVFGTSGVVLAATDEPLRDPLGRLHTFCHAETGRWFVMGVTQAAGGSLQWYRRRLAQSEEAVASSTGQDVYTLLMQEAGRVGSGADGLLFLPYLMGERTPHLNPDARGAWLGLEWRHERSHMVRAVLEGVSFSLRDCWEAMAQIGVTAREWRVSGGGAQGALWMEIFASVLDHDVQVMRGAQGPAYGAAILAAQGVSMLGHGQDAVYAWVKGGEEAVANSAWAQRYQTLYPLYKQAYELLQGHMKSLADWQR